MKFSDIINHDEVKAQLKNMVTENRLSHALFFLGKEGAGGLALGRALAQYMVCERTNKSAQPAGMSLFGEEEEVKFPEDSCGVCPPCIKASQLIHPDIHFTYPVIPLKAGSPPVSSDYMEKFRTWALKYPYSNSFEWLQYIDAENKQGNITARECEVILHNMNLKSFESLYKIQIIWMPEALGKEGNKLLKVIEEPPPNTLFILIAENEELVLPTILSRTQLVKIPAYKAEDIADALVEKHGADPVQARKIAAMSNGSYWEAIQNLDHNTNDWDDLLKEWMNSLVKTGPVAQLKFIEDISKTGREKQKQFLRYFTQLLQHTLHIIVLGEEVASKRESESIHQFATKLQRFFQPEQIDAVIHELDSATYQIERNANPKILFHALTIKLYHIISDKSLILVK